MDAARRLARSLPTSELEVIPKTPFLIVADPILGYKCTPGTVVAAKYMRGQDEERSRSHPDEHESVF